MSSNNQVSIPEPPVEEPTSTLEQLNEETVMFSQGYLNCIPSSYTTTDYRKYTTHTTSPRASKFQYKWDVVNLLMSLVNNNTGPNRQLLKKILTSNFDSSDFKTELNNAVIPSDIDQNTLMGLNSFWNTYTNLMSTLTTLKAQLEQDQSIVVPTEQQMNGKHFLIRAGFIRYDPDPKTSAGGLYQFSTLSPNQHDELLRRDKLHILLNRLYSGDPLIGEDGNPTDLPAIKKQAYTLIPECANPPSWWPENADIENRWVPFMKPYFYEDTESITSDPEFRIQFVRLKELVDNDLPYTPTTTLQSGGQNKKNASLKKGGKKNASLKKRTSAEKLLTIFTPANVKSKVVRKKNTSLKKQSKKDLKKSRRASK